MVDFQSDFIQSNTCSNWFLSSSASFFPLISRPVNARREPLSAINDCRHHDVKIYKPNAPFKQLSHTLSDISPKNWMLLQKKKMGLFLIFARLHAICHMWTARIAVNLDVSNGIPNQLAHRSSMTGTKSHADILQAACARNKEKEKKKQTLRMIQVAMRYKTKTENKMQTTQMNINIGQMTRRQWLNEQQRDWFQFRTLFYSGNRPTECFRFRWFYRRPSLMSSVSAVFEWKTLN